jgi:hypothetical protein
MASKKIKINQVLIDSKPVVLTMKIKLKPSEELTLRYLIKLKKYFEQCY